MLQNIAVVGAGVSGLTCGVTLAEQGHRAVIFADETGQRTTSAAAAAIWYPYDAVPADKVIAWALETYQVLISLVADAETGVSIIELRTFARAGEIQIPAWAIPLGARRLPLSVIPSEVESRAVGTSDMDCGSGSRLGRSYEAEGESGDERNKALKTFRSGFSMEVPLMDTSIYLDYLTHRFNAAGGTISAGVSLARLEDVSPEFNLIVNCAGMGAKNLVPDPDLEPHRGQVVIVPKLNFTRAIVCDDAPLMYAIPRTNDCVFGGTNEVSNDCGVDPVATSRILTECSLTLKIRQPKVLAERVGLRPFRKSGVRVDRGQLDDGRPVIHNYGHGGSGFSLSWGCAREVLALARAAVVGSV
jgi:D-amino-acid oxidase